MSQIVLETSRCYMREFHPADAVSIVALNQHPDIFRFTTDPPFKSVDEARAFLESYPAYRTNGFGRWAVLLKSDNSFVGWSGLKYLQSENEVDVGYRLLPEFWGMGIGPETGAACIRYGFELGIKRIVARVHKENYRSQRVSEKLGMRYECDLFYNCIPWMNYSINATDNVRYY
ncbi:MAG TPA: GNAT family N-acetyltransferase [Bacteroidia bacterium]|nr:GNAT family N-acetyltransferase [Bacteroidia bacterium]